MEVLSTLQSTGVSTTWLDAIQLGLELRDQASFEESELYQQLQMSASHPTHLECPTPLNNAPNPLNNAPTGITQHPNNQPPTNGTTYADTRCICKISLTKGE